MSRHSAVLAAGLCLLLASLACSLLGVTGEEELVGSYKGTGEKTNYYFEPDKCTGPSEVTLTINRDKSVVLVAIGKGHTFGMDGCVEDPVDTAYTITGTIDGLIVTFKECNGRNPANGKATFNFSDGDLAGAAGELGCMFTNINTGEKWLEMSLTFNLVRVP